MKFKKCLLVLLYLFNASKSDVLTIRRCCAENKTLIQNETRKQNYLCSEDAERGTELRNGRNAAVSYGLPKNCDSYKIEKFDEVKRMTNEYCVDTIALKNDTNNKTEDLVVILTCDHSQLSKKEDIKILHINKCCKGDTVYDSEHQSCVPNTLKTSNFEEFINDKATLIYVNHGFSCDTPNIIYKFTSNKYKFDLNKDGLVIKGVDFNKTFENFCLDDTTDEYLISKVCKSKCEHGICLNKCCPEGKFYKDQLCNQRLKCVEGNVTLKIQFHDIGNNAAIMPAEYDGQIGLRNGLRCSKYQLNSHDSKDENYIDIKSGNLWLPAYKETIKNDQFCVETMEKDCNTKEYEVVKFACFQNVVEPTATPKNCNYGLFVSCLFLFLTLTVYALLPQLRNLHGKTLMCQLSSMFIAYLCLALANINIMFPVKWCTILGYILVYSFLASFSWLNIMCIDIFHTLRNTRAIPISNKHTKKFIQYSVYGWGLPFIITGITFIIDNQHDIPVWLDPNIGLYECWFHLTVSEVPWLIFFVLPMAMMVIMNSILFVYTVVYCNKVKKQIERMQNGSNNKFMADKARLVMNIKLFILMGSTWILEVIASFIKEPKWFWYVADTVNTYQGILIFCILILKKKFFNILIDRIGLRRESTQACTTATISTTAASRKI